MDSIALDVEEPQVKRAKNQTLWQPAHPARRPGMNLGQTERLCSALAGGLLLGAAFRKKGMNALTFALAGGTLLYRGAAGHSRIYELLKMDNSDAFHPANRSIHVEKSITIARPSRELYDFWRNFENHPKFMHNLIAVRQLGSDKWLWIIRRPDGRQCSCSMHLINDIPGRTLSWESIPDDSFYHAGSVNFADAPRGRGTEVRVVFNYKPPAGRVGQLVASIFGAEPGTQFNHNLRRFKSLMETGEIPTIERQPSCRATPN